MNSKYKIIFVIAGLLLFLSISFPIVNYLVSLHNTKKQLQTSSLPLSTDNIYSEIQTNLIEPNIVASMMAQDTFLKDWLINKEKNPQNIQRYLESIKNKYKMHTVFLVGHESLNYYMAQGFVEKISKEKPKDSWYFQFSNSVAPHEINVDFNKHIDKDMVMFINHKVFDEEYHLLGATGVGLRLSYIDDMLKKFRMKYKFKVYFIDKNGEIIIKERGFEENPKLNKNIDDILNDHKTTSIYTKDGVEYITHTKFIPELDLHIFVEAKISDFTQSMLQTLYINILLSLFITIIIILIIVQMVHKYSDKLELFANYDPLTNLLNRRVFDATLHQQLLLHKRKKTNVCVLFFDIDDFKKVNDTFGHEVGDKVLKRFAKIIQSTVRASDCVARWGGEEFIIALIDSSFDDSKKTAEKLRLSIEEDPELHSLLSDKLTASFGLSQIESTDTVEVILARVDKALYEAKNTGKNKVVLA